MHTRVVALLTLSCGAWSRCVPREPIKTWLFASGHKSGTALLEDVIGRLEPQYLANSTHRRHKVDIAKQAMSKVPGILLWKHVSLTKELLELVVSPYEEAEGRAAIFLRDPIEIILSGYLYHLTTTEKWVNVPVGKFMSWMLDVCDSEYTCASAELLRNNPEMTYQELLHALDAEIGVIVEANRAYEEIVSFNRTLAASKSAPKGTTMVCSLDNVMHNFSGSMEQIFTFLGATDVKSCLGLVAPFDVTKKPRAKAHVMPRELVETRNRLRSYVYDNHWFKKYVEPIRRSMHYTNAPLPNGEALTDSFRCQGV